MKLNLIFAMIDFPIILAYPFLYIAKTIRQLSRIKR
jgi:hypothetical protein